MLKALHCISETKGPKAMMNAVDWLIHNRYVDVVKSPTSMA